MDISSTFIPSLNPCVDVYKIGNDILEFYFITTRERITIQASSSVISFIQLVNGHKSIREMCEELEVSSVENVLEFCKSLNNLKILVWKSNKNEMENLLCSSRYSRQLLFFESRYRQSAFQVQDTLEETRFVIFGAGAIGGGIALQLAMMGAKKFVLIDKDVVSEDSEERHFYFQRKLIGKKKVVALKSYIKNINNDAEVIIFDHLIDYNTNLDEYLKNADFVVNSMDEPYIGNTSMKIGRACYEKNIPLYVAGGFDAHLMSTGEIIIPEKTPCVDCYVAHFSNVLKDWKPKYNVEAISKLNIKDNRFEVGGLASMSLFSVSYAVLMIIDYLAGLEENVEMGRGEMLFDEDEIQYIKVKKNPNCHVCSSEK